MILFQVATPVDWKAGGSCMVVSGSQMFGKIKNGFSHMDWVATATEMQVPGVKQEDAAGLFPKGVKVLLALSIDYKSY